MGAGDGAAAPALSVQHRFILVPFPILLSFGIPGATVGLSRLLFPPACPSAFPGPRWVSPGPMVPRGAVPRAEARATLWHSRLRLGPV